MFTEFLKLRLDMQPERLNPEEKKFIEIRDHLRNLGDNKKLKQLG